MIDCCIWKIDGLQFNIFSRADRFQMNQTVEIIIDNFFLIDKF